MGELATINIDRAVATAAANRAKQQGLTTEEYVSQLLLRDMEREPGEMSILAYNHVDLEAEFVLDREEGESDESYDDRSAHFSKLFKREKIGTTS
ncbi:hypothetical protein JQ634_01395 [Bradyrhizobium sp. AUGA SZCCT0240]|jgi:hypothetical protein|uniref:hypothetical protein n=1 Tax=unclassified Bradyrhizobium TaxID=2631580 RepID=UPI001BAD2942|nr:MULTISPECIES: hypothetical protein [unclassified Bradyrhizobium]MBR1195582.1 hypothetical protein [Bradyrhizobium sp. AUGA SZCCT0158]MBR1244641.1 hypothetical protein [Bradyrhizobium sp. AUGA SZCCT0274]MBR1252354.1 hypothetical protein [Bradyrhizobium sp. AUGA SZCCT0240]